MINRRGLAAQRCVAADERRAIGGRFAPAFVKSPLAAERRVVSSERRNISAMIWATSSGRPGWSVNGRATPDV